MNSEDKKLVEVLQARLELLHTERTEAEKLNQVYMKKIQDLEERLSRKEELVDPSDSEIRNTHGPLDVLIESFIAAHVEEVKELQTEVKQLRDDNMGQAQTIRMLEQRLKEIEEESREQKILGKSSNEVDPAKRRLPTTAPKQDDDGSLLLEKLPEVVWRLVLECASAQTLEALLEVSDFFHSVIESGDSVLMWPQVVPSVVRARINVAEQHLLNEQTLQIILSLRLSLKIATFSVQGNCSDILNQFLATQRDTLEKFHISTLESPLGPLLLKPPEMTRLLDLKVLTREFDKKESTDKIHTIHNPIFDVFPALQSLTMSVGGIKQWKQFFPIDGNPHRGQHRKACQNLRSFTLIDLPFSPRKDCGNWFERGFWLFPNLVSVEIPVREDIALFFRIAGQNCEHLRKVTLTRDLKATDMHTFDKFITGYCGEVCAEILENPRADPVEIQSRIRRRTYDPKSNITQLQNLEVLKIIHGKTCGPTLVSCLFFLKLKSLKILQFLDQLPKHITGDMVTKMERHFTVLCE